MAQINNPQETIFNNLYERLIENKNIDKTILTEIFENAKKIQQNTDKINDEQGRKVLNISSSYLQIVSNTLNNIHSHLALKKHISQLSLKQYYIDTIREAVHQQINTQNEVKIIYASTITYQKQINNILDKEIVTVFVFEEQDNTKFFYSTDLSAFVDATDIKFSSDGKIAYNLKDDIVNKMSQAGTGKIINTQKDNLSDHQTKLLNSYSLKKNFQTIGRISNNKDINNYDKFIKDNGLDRYFYTSKGEKRVNIVEDTQDFSFILKKLGLDRRNLKGLKKYFGNQYALEDLFNKAIQKAKTIEEKNYKRLIQIAHREMSEKTSSFEYRFTFDNKTYKVVNRGDIREAFFGAYYQLSNHKTFFQYLQDVDNVSGIFKGDFSVGNTASVEENFLTDFGNIYKDGKTLEIQIKSFNAGFNIPQFIELAQIIVELNNEEAIMKYVTERAKADSESTKGKNRNKDITEIVKKEKEQAAKILKST